MEPNGKDHLRFDDGDLQDAADDQYNVTTLTEQDEDRAAVEPPIRRSKSNLTVENLRRHEETTSREDVEHFVKERPQSGKGIPLDAIRPCGSPLVPVRGQKSLDVETPLVPGECLRIGSGQPLPPIGVESREEGGGAESNVDTGENGNREENGEMMFKSSHPSILQRPLGRESPKGEDRERDVVNSSCRSATAKSERSVSFKADKERLDSAKQPSRSLVPSPAIRELHHNLVNGEEKVSVSIATETEWSWLESLKIAGIDEERLISLSSAGSMPLQRKGQSTPSHDSNFSDMDFVIDEEVVESEGAKSRVPPLQIEADPEDAEIEATNTDNLIPSIGPPRIIQYQRETERPYTNESVLPEEGDIIEPIPGVSDISLPLAEIQEEGTVCEFCHAEIKDFPTPEMRDNFTSEELYCCEDYQKFVDYAVINTPLSAQPSDELIDITPHAPYGSKQARRAAKERAAARMREREIARQRASGVNQTNFYALQVARQMKTINYSLSSQKCLDEGWTLRPQTPDDSPPPPLAYEPIWSTTPPLRPSCKGRNENTIMERFYPGGQRLMIMFEDGSGTVFYSNGQTAIHIVKVDVGQFLYIAQDAVEKGCERGALLAIFEPQGRGTCYHKNGNIRLNMDQNEGTFADSKGALKKRWLWWDQSTHVHAPPFQPICFALNSVLSVRCLAQDQIYLSFSQAKMNLRFNVGVKLKLVAPENIPAAEIDEDVLYIADIRAYVQLVVDRISNQLHFSKSPKLGDILPQRKLKNDFIRNDRRKQENCRQKASGKDLPVVTVN